MAADDRTTALALTEQTAANDADAELPVDALLRALQHKPYAFDLYQALRRLECAFRDWPRVGTAARPAEEPVRFGQAVSLTAAPSTLSHFEPARGSRPAHLYNFFFGVLGPNGPLPLHMTEYAKQRAHLANDRSLTAFLDMFHHRMLSLFYRAHASADPVTQHDRPDTDRFAAYVASIIGLGLPSLRERDNVSDSAKLYYAGLFAPHTKNADGLCALLEDYFEVKAQIEEFVGEWVTLPAAQSWRLGQGPKRASPMMGRLSSTAMVGTRVWLRQHRFRIALGPLRHEQFQSLLPGTPGFMRMTALVRNYIGDELKWDLRLTAADEAIRPAQLGSGARLGRTSWLVTGSKRKKWEDLIVDPTQDYDRKVGDRKRKV
ncbi:MAG TPA: type VI secretion system baseplate subunit TssG [Polyangiales bacterium]|jgi:type VI secretion system protein ImpH|nr:type VI secretion system baseplate subunit TssG [Polyangiales bacterium]